ncbi:IS3 family transposase [Kitasatospora sp. NPDC017646]|uniref:IS3 family transposase n=1 Tax=Kitasatospora sp. NPDC017646 TaxID=3364024 RepID=UPI0037AE6F61
MDEHRGRFGGVEPICRVLTEHGCSIAPSTYYAHHQRVASPSARTARDQELKKLIKDVHDASYRVYGARKIWRELGRQGQTVARCTVERLMRELGITGAVRGKKVITTIADPGAERAPDLVDRDFVAGAPNRCWVADFTHIATWAGVVYVAFVVDTFSRRIVGWSAATSKETRLVLDALDMALWQRDRDGFPHQRGDVVQEGLAGCSAPGESLWILDWQHTCYRLRPDLPATDMFLPRVLEGCSREGWPLSPYPDGDYFIFLAEDLRFGTFGHPWEHSLCVFGGELLDAIQDDLQQLLQVVLRRDGMTAD